MNVISGTLRRNGAGHYVEALGAHWPAAQLDGRAEQRAHYGIRPTDIRLADSGIPAKVVVVEPTGAETELLVQVGDARLTVVMHGRTSARPDDVVHLAFDPAKAHVFDGETGQRLG